MQLIHHLDQVLHLVQFLPHLDPVLHLVQLIHHKSQLLRQQELVPVHWELIKLHRVKALLDQVHHQLHQQTLAQHHQMRLFQPAQDQV